MNTFNNVDRTELVNKITQFSDEMDLQLDIIETRNEIEDIIEAGNYDIIIIHNDNGIGIYGDTSNYHYDYLIDFLHKEDHKNLSFSYIDKPESEDNL